MWKSNLWTHLVLLTVKHIHIHIQRTWEDFTMKCWKAVHTVCTCGPMCSGTGQTGLTVAFSAIGSELGLVFHPWALGRVLHQQEGLLSLTFSHNALLVLWLADALQAKVAPAPQDEGAQGSNGNEYDDDSHHPSGGTMVHNRHGWTDTESRLGWAGFLSVDCVVSKGFAILILASYRSCCEAVFWVSFSYQKSTAWETVFQILLLYFSHVDL